MLSPDKEKKQEYDKQYYKTNSKKVRKRNQKWSKENNMKKRELSRKFYKKNAEKLREKSRKIYAQNPEKAIQKTKKWQINNPQKYKESHDKYRQNNLEKIRENDRKRNAAFKLKVFIHYSHGTLKCNCCGEMTFGFLTLDHINNDGHRQRKKGLNSTGLMPYLIKNNYPSGFQILCYNCNCGRAHTPDKKCPHLL